MNALPKIALYLLLALCIVSIPSLAYSQQLWNGTEVGLDISEVKTLFPDIKLFESDVDEKEDGRTNMVMEDYEIIDHPFDVNFHFRDGKLFTVLLSTGFSTDKESEDRFLELLVKLQTLLTEKYGDIEDQKLSDGDICRSHTVWWRYNDTDIRLKALNCFKYAIFLQYSSETAEALRKL